MVSFDMCVLRLSFQDVKYGGCSWHVINTVLFHFCRIFNSNMTAVFDMCAARNYRLMRIKIFGSIWGLLYPPRACVSFFFFLVTRHSALEKQNIMKLKKQKDRKKKREKYLQLKGA